MSVDELRMLVITDAHDGRTHADSAKSQQPPWVGGEAVLFERLRHHADTFGAQLIVDCGDLVHASGSATRSLALERRAAIDVPWGVALGNHDLTCYQDAVAWKQEAARFPTVTLAPAVVDYHAARVILVNNWWWLGEGLACHPWRDYDVRALPLLSAADQAFIREALSVRNDVPAVLALHCPAEFWPSNVPPQNREWVRVLQTYARQLHRLVAEYPNLKLILSGHQHQARLSFVHQATVLSTSSITEAPFEGREIVLSPRTMSIRTFSLAESGDPVQPCPKSSLLINGPRSERTIDVRFD